MSKNLISQIDIFTIRYQSFMFYIFILFSVLTIFIKSPLLLVFLIVFYLSLIGFWSLIVGRYHSPAYRLPEKMYKGTKARLIGIAHLIVVCVFIYYFW